MFREQNYMVVRKVPEAEYKQWYEKEKRILTNAQNERFLPLEVTDIPKEFCCDMICPRRKKPLNYREEANEDG